ncbi:hypothetical protein K438DRAFT_1158241 [Mycena galopus ATCC 62051]|nr:hypothetical protein K438DRAFT_1158241 [Mycena galopus ATCC 62051]
MRAPKLCLGNSIVLTGRSSGSTAPCSTTSAPPETRLPPPQVSSPWETQPRRTTSRAHCRPPDMRRTRNPQLYFAHDLLLAFSCEVFGMTQLTKSSGQFPRLGERAHGYEIEGGQDD